MNGFKNIKIEIKDRLATLWLNRPEKRNALDLRTIEEITEGFRLIEKYNKVLVILLRGKGKSFCAGADLNWMISSGKSGDEKCHSDSRKLAKCFNQIYKSSKVVINLVHGNIFGGGVGFAGAADFTIATRDSKFRLPELQLGLVPSVIMPYILLKVNFRDISFNIFTGEIFTAEEAYNKGLIDIICEDADEMEVKVKEMTGKFYTASPSALAETKQLIRKLNKDLISHDNIRRTVNTLTKMKMSDDAQVRMTRFIL